jgi:hypothetical protein
MDRVVIVTMGVKPGSLRRPGGPSSSCRRPGSNPLTVTVDDIKGLRTVDTVDVMP